MKAFVTLKYLAYNYMNRSVLFFQQKIQYLI